MLDYCNSPRTSNAAGRPVYIARHILSSLKTCAYRKVRRDSATVCGNMPKGFYLLFAFLFFAVSSSCQGLPVRTQTTRFHFVGRLRRSATSGDRDTSSGGSAESGSGSENRCPYDDEDCESESSGQLSGESSGSGCPDDDEDCGVGSASGDSSRTYGSGSGCPEDDEDCNRSSGRSSVNNGCDSTADDENCIASGSGSGDEGSGASGDGNLDLGSGRV